MTNPNTKEKRIHKFVLKGFIGETSDFLKFPGKNWDEIHLDMENVTYMNSIGVKQWILWTAKIPLQCKVLLMKCPYMIVSQASSVTGFLPRNYIIESFYVPYVCPQCDLEKMVLLNLGQHYDYAKDDKELLIQLPTGLTCSKCAGVALDTGFFTEKTFNFLKLAQ